MRKLRSIDEFYDLYDRIVADQPPGLVTMVIPAGTCGQASGANDLIRVAKRELLKKDYSNKICLRITGCHGFCEMEPSILIEPQGVFYPKVKKDDIARIMEASLNNSSIPELLWHDPTSGDPVAKQLDIPFFTKQTRTILSNNEKIDPIRIFNYLGNGGYQSLINVFEEGNPLSAIDVVKKSGLRGRGGAGFPTGIKWEMLATKQNGKGKYLVCNADEGDPGAYMDRSVLEGNPHSIIEGMLIGAYSTGADKGVVYVRNEYPLAIKHLLIALRQARDFGLLGENILGQEFNFDINVVKGAGAFVCGEETALIKSIEGKPGEPVQRPPYPIDHGIEGKPTVINNVETWANIPIIFKSGAESYSQVGSGGNAGSKIFSLVGKIKNTGLVEVPMGTSIKEIVYDIGGGPINNHTIKAVQTGGPSGGCIPEHMFDLSVDYDSLAKAGSIMGSGGMIVMDNDSCMVDVTKYFMRFLMDESCGKCFTCRKGTQRMYELLDDISRGEGTMEKLGLLKELSQVVKDTTMCGLGQTAANPVLSTLLYFEDEYIEHILNKKCPGGVCKELITYQIIGECTGCLLCIKACPEGAIAGKKGEIHLLDQEKCIKCGACKSVCKFDSIITF